MRAFLLFCVVLVGALWVDATYFGGQYSHAVDTILRQIAARYG
jgi:hypothetical protein